MLVLRKFIWNSNHSNDYSVKYTEQTFASSARFFLLVEFGVILTIINLERFLDENDSNFYNWGAT